MKKNKQQSVDRKYIVFLQACFVTCGLDSDLNLNLNLNLD